MFCFYHLINKQERIVKMVIIILLADLERIMASLLLFFFSVGFYMRCNLFFGNFGFFLTPHEIVTDGLLSSTGAEKNSTN